MQIGPVHTGAVRIYLPATLADLDRTGGHRADLTPRLVHAVTAELRQALLEDDDEGREYAALLTAADDSLLLVAATPTAPHQRLVLTAEVSDDVVRPGAEDAPPSLVRLTAPVPWDRVVCAHVDELAAVPDVDAALGGDADAVERLSERDLLWYDATELDEIPR